MSVTSPESSEAASAQSNVHSVYFYTDVTTPRLNAISNLIDRMQLKARVGPVMPLIDVRCAHKMLAGAPHQPGEIVLRIAP